MYEVIPQLHWIGKAMDARNPRLIPTILPYATIPVICQEYDPRTAEIAQQIAALVTAHPPRATVEHVGSTSVPGCAGKGIVDLMIPVADGELDAVKEVVDRLGFQRQANRDPFPEDRPMRVGAVIQDGETFLLHVHVIPAASPEVQEMRRFRDRLRADAELVASYVAKKRQIIASGVTDSLEYCYAKSEFVRVTLAVNET